MRSPRGRAHSVRRLMWGVVGGLLFATPAWSAEERHPAAPAFSPYVEANGVLYVSGHLPLRPGQMQLVEDDIVVQTHQVITNIARTLTHAGVGLANVVQVTVYLTSMEDFAAFNRTYAERLPAPYPARTTVAVSALAFGSRIEMSCIAVRGPIRQTGGGP